MNYLSNDLCVHRMRSIKSIYCVETFWFKDGSQLLRGVQHRDLPIFWGVSACGASYAKISRTIMR